MRKVRVNTEALVSALLLLGFDKIDALLYTYVLGSLKSTYNNERKNMMYEFDFFVDDSLSRVMSNCIKPNPTMVIELKDGIDLDTDVSRFCNLKDDTISLGEYIDNSNNRLLATFIEGRLNIEEIVCFKVRRLGIENINNFASLFSIKEKEIIERKMNIKVGNQKKKIKL